MDWYYESGGDELVPREQDVSDSFQLSDRWIQWGICPTAGFDSANKYFGAEEKSSGEIHFSHNKFSDEVEMDLVCHERDRSSAQSLNASGLCSMFSEHQSFVSNDKSGEDGNFMPERKRTKADDLSQHSTLDIHCGNTEMWDFSLSSEQKDKHSIASHRPLISEQKISASTRAHVEKESTHNENDCFNGCGDDKMSVEESLLLDFEFVMNQMSDKTRYCFRDALYRLARNSETPISSQNECDDNAVPNAWEAKTSDESSRYKSIEESEAQTNTIDRTVASLMFSNMNFSLGGHQQA
ncbi:unnamed protein product [Rhodiola kirilowii]